MKKKKSCSTIVFSRLNYESRLLVRNVSSSDYGSYGCVAQNEEGLDRVTVTLNVTSRPDPPSLLRVSNVTYNSVTVTWTQGFDGGYEQAYKIR